MHLILSVSDRFIALLVYFDVAEGSLAADPQMGGLIFQVKN
jgi:hypothetical protein